MKKTFLILCLMLSMFIVACGKGGKGSGNSVSFNMEAEPTSLDPQILTDMSGLFVTSMTYESLVRLNEKNEIIPAGAESWTKSDDGKVWTFKIRQGMKWSNGDPVTAKDYYNGIKRGIEPKTASEYAFLAYYIENAEDYNTGKLKDFGKVGIKAKDDYTLEFTLSQPAPFFLKTLIMPIYFPVNEKALAANGDGYATEAKKSIYNGPFIIEKWVHNNKVVMKKNPNYWDAANVKIETVVYKIIPDNNSALNAFNNKEVDVTSITSEQAKGFKDNPKMVSKNDGSVWYLLFNFNNKTLANLKVRKALLMAIDREGLINNVLNGYGTAAKTFVPKGIGITGKDGKDFTEFVPTSTLGYNPQEAKKLLAEGLKEAGQASFPKMSMLINESGKNKVIAEYIQEQLRKNLNIQLDLEIMTAQERFSRMSQKDFDMVFAGWSGDYPDAITYLDLFESTGGNNNGSYKNPEYDALVKTVRSTADQNVRIPALVKIEGIIAQDLPVGVLFHREKQYLVDKKVKGLEFTPIGGEYYFGNLSLK